MVAVQLWVTKPSERQHAAQLLQTAAQEADAELMETGDRQYQFVFHDAAGLTEAIERAQLALAAANADWPEIVEISEADD